jgi:hypothetical protein
MSLNTSNISVGLSLQQKLEQLSPKKTPFPVSQEAKNNDSSVDDLSSLCKLSTKMDSKRVNDEEVVEFNDRQRKF